MAGWLLAEWLAGCLLTDLWPAGATYGGHAAAGIGLGGHETAAVSGGPFSRVSDDTVVQDGIASLSDTPGTGIENKPELFKLFRDLL